MIGLLAARTIRLGQRAVIEGFEHLRRTGVRSHVAFTVAVLAVSQ